MFNYVGNDARLVFTGSLAKSPRVTHHASRGFEKAALVLFITVLALLFPLSPVTAQTDPTESYDENTELTVRGSVIEAKREMPGPFVIKLRTRNRTYNVVTAPPWYLTREQIVLREGLELEVTGSKYIGKDGNLFLLARQITDISTGKVIILRDTHCRPLWQGHRMQRGRNQQLP